MADKITILFANVEVFEAICVVAGKIRETISEVELRLGASNSNEEDANLLIGRVAGVADMFKVAWQGDKVGITLGFAPVFIIGSN